MLTQKEILNEVFTLPIAEQNEIAVKIQNNINKAVRCLLLLVEVCRMDKQILQNAFSLNFTDYEDAVQCASALAENLDAIVTRNTKDYKNSLVKIYSPSKFLQFLQTV